MYVDDKYLYKDREAKIRDMGVGVVKLFVVYAEANLFMRDLIEYCPTNNADAKRSRKKYLLIIFRIVYFPASAFRFLLK